MMEELPHSKSCFVCGSKNPLGLNLRFETDGQVVRVHWTPKPEHNGFKGVVHGGVIATILDEVMVWACSVRARKFFYCADMNVRYLAPVATGSPVIASGWLAENRRDRIYLAEGRIEDGRGRELVRSSGKYVPVRDADLAVFYEDFEGTPEQLRKYVPGFFPTSPG